MSLIRQIWLLLAAVVLLALAGAVGVNLLSSRDTLQAQLRAKNGDNAQSLALALSQQRGDAELMNLLLAAQFDTGAYASIRFTRSDGGAGFERRALAAPQSAPQWFVALLPIDAEPGVAQVSDGSRSLGRLEVLSQTAYAHDTLWRGTVRTSALLLAIGALAGLLAWWGVQRLRRPLDATVLQAHALVEGRYLVVAEPKVPELKRVAQAMNAMVQRVRKLFEAQAAQADRLRRQAHEDALTGLAQRAHFMHRVDALLQAEDGAEGGALLLVRLAELVEQNRRVGRLRTDAALRALAEVLATWPLEGRVAGRLNGSDLALCLPGDGADAQETAQAVAAALRAALEGIDPALAVHVGAVSWQRRSPVTLGALMAQADLALARAEGLGAYASLTHDEHSGSNDNALAAMGERGWHQRLALALDERRARLVEFALLNRERNLLHLECPLRVQLEPTGAFEGAAHWLPLAARSALLPRLDGLAAQLALAAIASDRRPRGINVALASLADGVFTTELRQRLVEAPQLARALSIEVGERAAVERFALVQSFAGMVRPLGVRLGLEHAGAELHRIDRLYELGLDFVKLDAAFVSGVADHEAARSFVASTVALLHALSIQVHAEGVATAADADALWACGIDGITGPWASERGVGRED